MDRKDALNLLENDPYPSKDLLNEDFEYICKKMKMKKSELEEYLNRVQIKHNNFPSEIRLWKFYLSISRRVKSIRKKIWSS